MSTPEIPKAKDFMKTRVECLSPDAGIDAAVHTLLRRGYSGAPVVDDDGKLIGVLSEHDCIKVLSHALYSGWPSGTVGDNMSTEHDVVDVNEDLLAIASRFSNGRHRRLPVVEDGRVVGLITRQDLVRELDKRIAPPQHVSTYEMIQARRAKA